MIRLHVTSDLTPGAAVATTLDQSRYLTQVMRLKTGDDLLVFNGRDGEWRASIAEMLKKGAVLRAEDQVRPQTLPPDVELLIAVIKKSAIEFAVEKATELGVARIRPIITARTQTQHLRLDRLDAIARESAEQTGRMDVPPAEDPVRLDTLLDGWDRDRRLMFCDEAGGEPALQALGRFSPSPSGEGGAKRRVGAAPTISGPDPTAPPTRPPDGGPPPRAGEGEPWAILIGPEGGFSPEERDRLRALPFAVPVSLGPRILRADTAAVAALTLWQAAIGDWSR